MITLNVINRDVMIKLIECTAFGAVIEHHDQKEDDQGNLG
jgi:hypothetical protein